MSSEKRQFTRLPIAYRVKLVADDRILAFPSALDISMGGILVGGPERLPVGSECGVAILLMDSESGKRVVARGTVVRSNGRGTAIAFSKALDPDSLKALRMLVRAISPEADQENPAFLRPAD